jgi:hypothetical protein
MSEQDPRNSESHEWAARDRRTGYRRKGDLSRSAIKRWLLYLTYAIVAFFVVAVVITFVLNQNISKTTTNTERVEQAVCTVVVYVERQLPNIKNPAAAKELSKLSDGMRATGVRCAARPKPKPTAEPTPTPSPSPTHS